MYAQVCIDIPAAQVNHHFTYIVPESMEAFMEIGIRVNVPFGKRQLLGIVVDITDQLDSSAQEYDGELKEISALLDYQSFLTKELVDMSLHIAQEIHTYRINVLMAMLPSMLKVKYETEVIIHDMAKVQTYLNNHGEDQSICITDPRMCRTRFESLFPSKQIKTWLQESVIELDYRLVDQTRQKFESYVQVCLNPQDYQTIQYNLSKQAHKQKRLLDALMAFSPGEMITQKAFTKRYQVNRQDLKKGQDKGWLTLLERPVFRNPLQDYPQEASQAKPLNPQQEQAYQAVNQSIQNHQSQTFLLHGVTGSGKTEVYLQLMQVVLDQNQSAILLVPEIALTPQMISQVYRRFQSGVAVLHSGLSTSEKYDEWRKIKAGQVQIVIGARSSIFAPLENIGLIIIDEEHETTYKQSNTPRYHARDIAIQRSHYHHCPVLLGSATPSLESMARAVKGTYQLLSMTQRINQKQLPPVNLVDMTQVGVKNYAQEISPILAEKIRDRLQKHEQIILLLNRRGYGSFIQCRECGYVMECPNCDISLTYHKFENRVKCHYCDHHQPAPQKCPSCGSSYIHAQGMGTQKITETVQHLFPKARIIRMDNDTTRRKNAHRNFLQSFANHEADILIGTQMIAKGLDIEKVTLVGVINADTSLNLPDFRASEKTFQLLTQVSGRAGRGQYPGEVVIQTYNPDHYVLQLSQTHDYQAFFYHEMTYRHLGKYPPYYFTSLITVSANKVGPAQTMIYQLKRQLLQHLPGPNKGSDWIVLGPNQGPIARINNQYYFQLLLKYKSPTMVKDILTPILDDSQRFSKKGVYITIDHEPLQFI